MPVDHYDIEQIKSIEADAHGIRIGLGNGSFVFLDGGHPDYTWIRERVRHSERTGGVLGILLDAERNVIDVGGTYRGLVAGMQQYRPGMPDIEVWFAGLDGPMRLAADMPEFATFYEDLVHSRETGQPVWYIMKGGYLLDVRVLSPADDALVCQRIEQKG